MSQMTRITIISVLILVQALGYVTSHGDEDADFHISETQRESADVIQNKWPENQVYEQSRQRDSDKWTPIPHAAHGITESKECSSDVERLCRHTNQKLEVLHCMINSDPTDENLTRECREYFWSAKLNLTIDPEVLDDVRQFCDVTIDNLPDCKRLRDQLNHGEYVPCGNGGKLIPCLLDSMDKIKDNQCHSFLVKIASIIYSDYRLIFNFVEDCQDDINYYGCDPLNTGNDIDDLRPQGAVIKCLQTQLTDDKPLEDECMKQIVRLSELTADDFHMDRNFFFKCRDDRERMCEEVVAGEGRVYKCLFKHKFDHEMSTECREAMTMRQKLVAHDYKASYDLRTFCSNDIKKHRCLEDSRYTADGTNDHNDVIGLSGVLLCLEDAMFTEQNKVKQDSESVVSEACRVRLDDFRRMLGEDYQLSPEIVKGCSREITDHCGDGVNKRGETIHCLMGLAQNKETRREGVLGHECEQAIMHLLKEDHAAADYRMDYALAKACNPVVITACGSYQEGDPMVLSCLMEHLNADVMKEDCRKRLLELQYFIGRDFYLDPKFFKKCHTDAARLCHIEGLKDKKEVTMPYSLVISCLYRHIPAHTSTKADRKTQTSRECAEEVIEAMKQRALDMDLNPDLEEACRHALGEFCSDGNHDSGTEFQCLQDNISNITGVNCVSKIEESTEVEAKIGRNGVLAACASDIPEFCKNVLEFYGEGAVADCLIKNKAKLQEECRATLTRLQMLEMKDVKISYNFMTSCKNDIGKYCPHLASGKHSKIEVIHCLSGQQSSSKHGSYLDDDSGPLSQECSERLVFESLQRHENIELHPDLMQACQGDLKKLCLKVRTGNARGIECLREHNPNLSPRCRKQIFKLAEEEANNRNLDFALKWSCVTPLKKFCYVPTLSNEQRFFLDCLIHSKEFLDQGCREIVTRREIEQFSSIELNPEAKEACSRDIQHWCYGPRYLQQRDIFDGLQLQSRVVNCLKEVYTSANKSERLTGWCGDHIQFIMKEQKIDYRLDSMLVSRCHNAVRKHCDSKQGDVVECLKRTYFDRLLENDLVCTAEVIRLLKEGQSSIMADPVLHSACAREMVVHCGNLPPGDGEVIYCLTNAAEEGENFTPHCTQVLEFRKKLWARAGLSEEDENSSSTGYGLSGTVLSVTATALVSLLLGIAIGWFLRHQVQYKRDQGHKYVELPKDSW